MTGNPTIQLNGYELRGLLERAERHVIEIETRLIADLQAKRRKMNRLQLWWYGDPLERIREIERGAGGHVGAYFRRWEMPLLRELCKDRHRFGMITVGADLIEELMHIARAAGETF